MRILVVKTSSLGDIIHAFPVVSYLKCLFPSAQIDWVVEQSFAGLVQAHPDIQNVLKIQSKKWRKGFWKKENRKEMNDFRTFLRSQKYDVLFDLQGNVKSACVTAMAKAELKVGFGRGAVAEWPNLLVTNRRYTPPLGKNIRYDYLFLAQCIFGNFQSEWGPVKLKVNQSEQDGIQKLMKPFQQRQGPNILVCPGSNWPNKQLSPATLSAFLNLIQSHLQGHFFLIWGNAEEKELAQSFAQSLGPNASIVDRLSLPALQNVMYAMDVVIAMDSLPLHLAATTHTPTYSVFGASLAHKYQPIGSQHQAFQGRCPYQKTFEKRCSILRTCSTGSCIKDIPSEHLAQHFLTWWHQWQQSRQNE